MIEATDIKDQNRKSYALIKEYCGEAPYLQFSFLLETSAGTHGLFCRRRWGNSTEMKSFSEPTRSSPLAYNFQNVSVFWSGSSKALKRVWPCIYLRKRHTQYGLFDEQAGSPMGVELSCLSRMKRMVLPRLHQPQESGQKILILVLSYSHQQRVGHNPFTKEAFGR